jgi:hypothetical protein
MATLPIRRMGRTFSTLVRCAICWLRPHIVTCGPSASALLTAIGEVFSVLRADEDGVSRAARGARGIAEVHDVGVPRTELRSFSPTVRNRPSIVQARLEEHNGPFGASCSKRKVTGPALRMEAARTRCGSAG